ncbi:MAG: hypothetical protein IPJ41_14555 [Phycisphaerales bacterium]|nr:hypothetical protein [Phycisphaerales bacterium]
MFVCETYGGESAFLTGEVERDHELPDGRTVRYTWEQREANPLTGMVTDVLQFEILRGAQGRAATSPEAFVYCWALWSVSEPATPPDRGRLRDDRGLRLNPRRDRR